MPARSPDPRRPRRAGRPRRDDVAALVTAAITEKERAVAVEAIACALTGNTVRISPGQARRTSEIVEIVDLVAAELDADVRISARPDRVEVAPPVR
jgi:sRNA-binding protein